MIHILALAYVQFTCKQLMNEMAQPYSHKHTRTSSILQTSNQINKIEYLAIKEIVIVLAYLDRSLKSNRLFVVTMVISQQSTINVSEQFD